MEDKPRTQTCEIFCAVLLYVAMVTGVVLGLYNFAKEIDKVRHVELSNCTTVDAHPVWNVDSGTRKWVVHVNFSLPPAYHQPPNTTHMSLLKGANPNDNYFANQTFPCYVSTRDSYYVALTPQKPDGDMKFGVVSMSILSFLLIAILVLSIFGYWQEHSTPAPPTNSSVREAEQIRLARVETRPSFDSSTTIVVPSDLEACDLGRRESSETAPSITKTIVWEAAATNMQQVALDESTGGGLNKSKVI